MPTFSKKKVTLLKPLKWNTASENLIADYCVGILLGRNYHFIQLHIYFALLSQFLMNTVIYMVHPTEFSKKKLYWQNLKTNVIAIAKHLEGDIINE